MPLKSEHEIYRPTRGLNPAPPADRSGRCALCLSPLSHRGRPASWVMSLTPSLVIPLPGYRIVWQYVHLFIYSTTRRWTDRRNDRNGTTLSHSACWCMRATKLNSIFMASVNLFELGVRTPGVYFWAYCTPGVSIFGVFRTLSLHIFGVIFDLHEATKMYKLF